MLLTILLLLLWLSGFLIGMGIGKLLEHNKKPLKEFVSL